MNILYSLITFVISYLLYDFIKKNIKTSKNDLPGPLAMPLLGNLHQLGELPHVTLTKLDHKYKGIYRVYFGDIYTVVVSDLDILRQMFVREHFANFANRPKLPSFKTYSNNFQSIGFSDREVWSKVHPCVVSALTKTKVISKYSTTFEEKTRELIKSFNERCKETGSAIIDQDENFIKKYVFTVLMEVLFSYKEEQNNDFIMAVKSLLTFLTGFLSDFVSILTPFSYFSYKTIEKQYNKVMKTIDKMYDDHLANLDRDNPTDLLDQLIIETKEKQLIKNSILDIVLAGSDTTISTMEFFLLFLINYPEYQEKIYNEIVELFGKDRDYIAYVDCLKLTMLNSFFKETHRVKPPGPVGLFRYAREDCYVGENNKYFIPKNTMVIPNIYGFGNSTRFVENPEKFYPERWLKDYKSVGSNEMQCGDKEDANDTVQFKPEQATNSEKDKYYNQIDKLLLTFSIGGRSCPGEQMARVEILPLLSNLIYNFKFSSIDGKKLDETEHYLITSVPKQYGVKITKRNRASSAQQ